MMRSSRMRLKKLDLEWSRDEDIRTQCKRLNTGHLDCKNTFTEHE